ncbi:hypothetical protein AX774_g1208 [Zancudomyces culisetae]|uniref:RRM domain-containing protein n=1 Tax=Zancudomyces culisetae TaxID=1213189 RepID=A0A1R1PW84_ZANCU|nr:hypothetical protein AX774_g1208 [Zancudomyces culisetae]|eukprot:OMH85255.1 hypothetical protein AX774_g1208 [Zancudomyces culisetae]
MAPAAGTSGTTTGKNEVTPTLSVSGINWWTTEDELRDIISVVGVEKNIKEIAFRENKINGKSLGAVNIEFIDIESSEKAKAKLTQL